QRDRVEERENEPRGERAPPRRDERHEERDRGEEVSLVRARRQEDTSSPRSRSTAPRRTARGARPRGRGIARARAIPLPRGEEVSLVRARRQEVEGQRGERSRGEQRRKVAAPPQGHDRGDAGEGEED